MWNLWKKLYTIIDFSALYEVPFKRSKVLQMTTLPQTSEQALVEVPKEQPPEPREVELRIKEAEVQIKKLELQMLQAQQERIIELRIRQEHTTIRFGIMLYTIISIATLGIAYIFATTDYPAAAVGSIICATLSGFGAATKALKN